MLFVISCLFVFLYCYDGECKSNAPLGQNGLTACSELLMLPLILHHDNV